MYLSIYKSEGCSSDEGHYDVGGGSDANGNDDNDADDAEYDDDDGIKWYLYFQVLVASIT